MWMGCWGRSGDRFHSELIFNSHVRLILTFFSPSFLVFHMVYKNPPTLTSCQTTGQKSLGVGEGVDRPVAQSMVNISYFFIVYIEPSGYFFLHFGITDLLVLVFHTLFVLNA